MTQHPSTYIYADEEQSVSILRFAEHICTLHIFLDFISLENDSLE
jgi:hypothetical protein